MQAQENLLLLGILSAFSCSAQVTSSGQLPFSGPPDLVLPGVAQATGLTFVDLNNDGRKDLLALSGRNASLIVLLQRERKKFELARSVLNDVSAKGTRFVLAGTATRFALGDFNKDGNADLAIPHHDLPSVWILLGNGNGSFRRGKSLTVPVKKSHCHMIATEDVNHDGNLDLLLAESDDNRAWVYVGDGKGSFTTSPDSPHPTGNHPYIVSTGDFNNDGHVDFATPDWFGKTISVFLGEGKGTFRSAPGSPVLGLSEPIALAAGDLTGDGRIDLVVGNNGDRGLQVLVGDGKGGFRLGEIAELLPRDACFGPVLADLNADGRLDVLGTATDEAPTFSYWLNEGGGRFSEARSLLCAGGANTICVADLDGDGIVDIAVGGDVAGTSGKFETLVWFGKKRTE